MEIISSIRKVLLAALFLICSCSRGHQPKTNATGLLYQVEPYGGKPRVEYINAAGEVALVPALSSAWSGEFHEGLAVAWSGQENDGKTKWGFMDRSGRIAIVLKGGEEPDSFSEGIAAFGTGGTPDYHCGYMNRSGVVLVDLVFHACFPFSEGLATVTLIGPGHGFYADDVGGGKCGYIDKSGKLLAGRTFDTCGAFRAGLAVVGVGTTSDQVKGMIDNSGKTIIPLRYQDLLPFSEALAVVRIGEKWGYLDTSGLLAIEARFEGADSFSDGLARVRTAETIRYIDKTGTFVSHGQSYSNCGFSEGAAPIKVDGKYGYIDKSGKFVIKPTYDRAYQFYGGVARVLFGDDVTGWKAAYINSEGTYLWRASRSRLSSTEPGCDTRFGGS
jgi:hypothetical protein